jgi:MFS transporter, DHA1 family, tetracycline resistance protein
VTADAPAAAPVSKRSGGRPSLLPILAVNFIGALGFSIVLPFLVFLVTRWGGNALLYGALGATYSAFQLVGAPVLGRWSDRWGRKRVLLVSQLGTLVSWAVFLAAFALPQTRLFDVDAPGLGRLTLTLPLACLFLARALDGVTGGNVSVANAYLADVTTEETRSADFGRMSMVGNLGFVLGPALAGLLGTTSLGEVGPVLAALAISLVATLIIALRLEEAPPCVLTQVPGSGSVHKTFGQEQKECFELAGARRLSAAEILRLPGIVRLLAINFLVMLGFSVFYAAFPLFAAGPLSWSIAEVGLFYSVFSLLLVAVEGPLLTRLTKRFADGALVAAGSLVLSLGFALFAGGGAAIVYAGVVLLALGNGVMWPSVLSILSRTAGKRVQGAVQGLAGSAGAVASIVGLLLGGAAFASLQARVFLLSAGVIGIVVLLAVKLLLTAGVRRPAVP